MLLLWSEVLRMKILNLDKTDPQEGGQKEFG